MRKSVFRSSRSAWSRWANPFFALRTASACLDCSQSSWVKAAVISSRFCSRAMRRLLSLRAFSSERMSMASRMETIRSAVIPRASTRARSPAPRGDSPRTSPATGG